MRKIFIRILLITIMASMLSSCDKTNTTNITPEKDSAPTSSSGLDIGGIEYVKISTTASGDTLPQAIDLAIKLAIEQVNGKTIESSSMSFQKGFESNAEQKYEGNADVRTSSGNDSASINIEEKASITAKSSGYADFIKSQSRGAVTDFKIISQDKDFLGKQYTVTIEANIAKYKQADSAKRLKIALAPMRYSTNIFPIDVQKYNADQIALQIQNSLSTGLTNSERVSVLDRDADSVIDSELDLVNSGEVSNENYARLGQQLLADFIWVGTIEAFEYIRNERSLRTSDRKLVSHIGLAKVSYKLIDVTTRQIVTSGVAQFDLPETAPTTMGIIIEPERIVADMIKNISNEMLEQIISGLFPVTVLSISGNDVVLSQGEPGIKVGEKYRLVKLGEALTDPQTGQSLGRIEKDCGIVDISRSDKKLSYGVISQSSEDLPETIKPGELVIRERINVINTTDNKPSTPISTEPIKKKASSPVTESTPKVVEPIKTAKQDEDW